MKKLSFKSIRSKLTFWFIILGLTPLLIGIFTTYQQQSVEIQKEAFSKLVAIRDLKVNEVKSWLESRKSDISVIATDNALSALELIANPKQNKTKTSGVYKNVRRLLTRYFKNYQVYDELFIINPQTGIVDISTNRDSEGMDRSDDSYFTEPMRTHTLFIKDIYFSNLVAKNMMTFSIPIFNAAGGQRAITGILVARLNLRGSLFALLQNRVGLGKTGETLIVNQHLKALSELRRHEDAPLNLTIEAEPAVNAARGSTGIIESTDYAGQKVLAAYTFIPQTKWGFVAKQNLSELYAPIKTMLLHFVVVVLTALAAIFVMAFFIARAIAGPVTEMARTAAAMQQGDLSARSPISDTTELSVLAKAFNAMAESIESMTRVRTTNNAITQSMVGAIDLQEFRTRMLKELVQLTGSQMGVYFVRNEETDRFEPFTSMGVSPGFLTPFDGRSLEGELGMAVESGNVTRIQDIPEDSIFKFRSFTGTILPKEIITIPIVIEGVAAETISLASIKPYPKEVIDLMDQPWKTGAPAALSNLLSTARTVKLAGELEKANQGLQAQMEELQSQSEELQSQSQELQAQSEELRQRTEELQAQNQELEVQRLQVEEADRLKSEFLSNMSHELRTPLNSVMALSRVLLMQAKEKLTKDETGYLEIIERNGKNLLALINDILDLSKIEAGKMDVRPGYFRIGSTIETIMERLEPLADDKGIRLKQKTLGDLPEIESDQNRVHQILQNLIGNAVKFTEQGQVTVSAHCDGTTISIEVTDTGIGIPAKDLPHIFEEFRQVDGSSSRSYEGTGLGLAIAFKAVTMLGGNISVASTEGKGTEFVLSLPVTWQGMTLASSPVTITPPLDLTPTRKTILVVDDAQDARAMISDSLSVEGYNVITAGSGKEALTLARTHHPFAITLDIVMPEMDGWEVLQKLKQDPNTRDIPVIIVSVSDDSSTGVALGAVGYVSKPIKREMLIAEIDRIGVPAPCSILIADDNAFERQEMAAAIEEKGMHAVTANDGAACLEMLEQTVPDILVLDLVMPGKNGFEVLESIRTAPKTRDLPVIVVTAKDLSEEERRQLSGNASSVLAKSDTTSSSVLEEIKTILAGFEKPQQESISGADRSTDGILLVEDSESAIIQVKTILEQEGYRVDVARGGQEALDYMERSIPRGIILDLMMPEIDGFQVLNRMRSTRATAGIPVLVLTARDLTPEDLAELTNNNVQQLIQKGDVDRKELLSKIRLSLGLKSEEKPKCTSSEAAQENTDNGQQPASAAPRTSSSEKTATILVVEDNPDNMSTLKAVLQNRYTILEAMDGEEGLDKILAERPDLVLLDISLPKMDGYTVVGKVKKNEEIRHIPIIALTANAMRGDREKIINAGCDDYISKPIDPELIIQRIKFWLKR